MMVHGTGNNAGSSTMEAQTDKYSGCSDGMRLALLGLDVATAKLDAAGELLSLAQQEHWAARRTGDADTRVKATEALQAATVAYREVLAAYTEATEMAARAFGARRSVAEDCDRHDFDKHDICTACGFDKRADV